MEIDLKASCISKPLIDIGKWKSNSDVTSTLYGIHTSGTYIQSDGLMWEYNKATKYIDNTKFLSIIWE